MSKKVLIVDDEPNIVAALEFLLEKNGYQVRVATNGEEALGQLDAFAPDLVLLDVMVPKVSGYEVCQRMRAEPKWRDMRIVMLSAKGREVEVEKGMSVGADLYVTKPFSSAELVATIRELLSPPA
ncbi:MAG: response regulator [Betaproteobacteria bacterium]|nr:response regulator [Betaproteobacteria bacterium]MDH5222605.1 response regulator [Betaproteobacteria bacterium]MDH5352209.1 response regulator [Betaproteobacteria bacterium]